MCVYMCLCVCLCVCVSVCVCLCVTSFPKIMMDPSGKINNTQQWVLQNREHNMKQPCDVCSQDPIEQNSKGHQPSVQLYAVYPFMAI